MTQELPTCQYELVGCPGVPDGRECGSPSEVCVHDKWYCLPIHAAHAMENAVAAWYEMPNTDAPPKQDWLV
jgi:hypothetical protein